MISLEKYIEVNKNVHKYDLPLSFFEQIKFIFIQKFLSFLPFKDKIFVDSDLGSWYWEIINYFLYKEYEVQIYKQKRTFQGVYTHVEANVWAADIHKHSKGHGQSLNSEDEAISKAIGEFIEREVMSGFGVDADRFKKIKLEELKKKVGLISDFHSFSKEQIKNTPVLGLKKNDEQVLECVEVEDVFEDKNVFYPAQCIFMDSGSLYRNEGQIYETTTSGCGAGFTEEMASLAAIYELIERDSFFCYWLTKSVPEIIEINAGQIIEYDKLKKTLNILGYDLYVLNTTTNFQIPSIVCVCVDRFTKGVCVSGGANVNFKKAIRSAVSEMYMCLGVFHDKKESFFYIPEKYTPFIDKKIGRTERLNLWNHGKYFEYFNFFISGKKVNLIDLEKTTFNQIFEKDKREWIFLVKFLKMQGISKIYRYLSTDTVLKRMNYFVSRVIIPEIYPLYLQESKALVNSIRLNNFVKWKNGYENFAINIFPHPFP